LKPMALPCLSPNLSESSALATGRWTPWNSPTRSRRANMSVNPLAHMVAAEEAPYPSMLAASSRLGPSLRLRAPAGILAAM